MKKTVELKVGDLVRVGGVSRSPSPSSSVASRAPAAGVVVALGGAVRVVRILCYNGEVVTCHPLRCQLLARGSS
jgi:hypothetical protein